MILSTVDDFPTVGVKIARYETRIIASQEKITGRYFNWLSRSLHRRIAAEFGSFPESKLDGISGVHTARRDTVNADTFFIRFADRLV